MRVDRIWPRGLAKDRARVDLWLKEVAPSTGLRRWFRHDPKRWNEFTRRYFKELEQHSELLRGLKSRARREPVTLLYAAKDEEHNNVRR